MKNQKQSDVILVLDFGTQKSQLIARKIRNIGVYSQILPFNSDVESIQKLNPSGIIFSGGDPFDVEEALKIDDAIFKLKLPILGIDYGKDVILNHLDKKPSSNQSSEIEDLGNNFYGIRALNLDRNIEVLENFIINTCKCNKTWNMANYVDQAVEQIRETVGDKQVLCGLSGGVDSSVAAVLIHKAIGDQLVCVFVNNAMLRKGEAENVQKVFKDNYSIRLQYADAQDSFLSALKGITEPEAKRKAIGKVFIDTFYNEARKAGDISFLAQGTLYPDVVESQAAVDGKPTVIKSHHNVGGLPEDLKWELLEPLRELFKDEVRELGRELGLPENMVNRHPFPGPGLGVRCVGEVVKERLDTLREVDAIFIEEITKAGLYGDIWQALACLLPVKSVGVKDGQRTYREACTLRAVNSVDAMSADCYRMPYEVLEKVSARILNEVEGVSRVLYDISAKPPGTIEWE